MMRATAAQLLFSSQTSCRVLLIGLVFSILHTAGILVSAYLMTDRILEPDLPEKPQFHVCTEALFCPFYVILTGLPGITVQIVGSSKDHTVGGMPQICFKSLQMHTQGWQKIRNFVRNSKILIARSIIQPKLSKIKKTVRNASKFIKKW